MKLFVIYIGGAHEKSLIELHDMRFVVAKRIEETYVSLRQTWWGRPESLHLDAWGSLEFVEGYELKLSFTPVETPQPKLFFVNLGGYSATEFTELHKNIFVLAETSQEAKLKAVQQVQSWISPHRDYQFEVDTVLSLDPVLAEQGVYLHLRTSAAPRPFEFTCQYVPIGR